MDRRPTIADVARLANVSTATVSHVINETRFVSEVTRQAVLAAIQQLNYRPSALAKALASRKTCLVGVVLSDIDNPLFRNIYTTIEHELSGAGYDLILANTGEDIARQHSILEALLSRQVDGLIVAPNYDTAGMPNPLDTADVPVVLIDRLSGDARFPSVTVDNEDVTHRAISHLIADGHRHIGFIGGLMDNGGGVSTVSQRLAGFRRALHEHAITLRDDHVHVYGKARQADGYAAARRILSASPRPTALFTTNLLLLLGVFEAMRALGLRCPDDIGVISFDHDHWTDIYVPPISLVKQPTASLGAAAAQQLIALMNGSAPLEQPHQVLPCEIVVRGSCSPRCWHNFRQQTQRDRPARSDPGKVPRKGKPRRARCAAAYC